MPKPLMDRLTNADQRLSDQDIIEIIGRAVPAYAFRAHHEWTWTRPAGVWKVNYSQQEDRGGPQVTIRLESAPGSTPMLRTHTTRREINAALRWMVLVDAIDRHPDDPIPAQQAMH